MFPIVTKSREAYKQEVDYKGFNKAIRVTLVSYHRSGIYRVHPQVTQSKHHTYTYNYYFNLERPID